MDRTRWKKCEIYYIGHIRERKFGVGFVVGERLRRRVLAFTPMDERLVTIRIKTKFFNTTLISAHASTEEKDDVTKDSFYGHLERTDERCAHPDVKIELDDLNARLGKEGIFGTTVGKISLHDETSPNGLRLMASPGLKIWLSVALDSSTKKDMATYGKFQDRSKLL